MTIEVCNIDNMRFEVHGEKYDLIFSDYVYENLCFDWVDKYWNLLKPNSIFIAMTDYNSSVELGYYMKYNIKANRVCKWVWKNEWGNYAKNKPHECYDEIFVYSNSNNWVFHPEKIQVDKVTKTKGLNPSGRETKPATAWIDDCTLTTTSLERVKKDDGHLIRWQKPQKLYDRIISPFVDGEHNTILDPFGGTFSLGLWCKNNNMNYVGIENDKEVFRYGKQNIFGGK
jgi:DNA modification methylase